jgi:endonuclease G
MLLRLASLIAAAALSTPALAAGSPGFEACSQDFYRGFAPRATTLQPGKLRALCFDDFAVLHSGQSKVYTDVVTAADELGFASYPD